MRIIVIGGGITGLSAAHRLIELSRERELPLEVVLLEGGERLGGVIATKQIDGFLVEEGPDSFITTKPWTLELCHRIGLDSQLIQTNDESRRTFVLHRGSLVPIPDGFFMIAPTRLMPFLTSPLFSWRGKLRMALDLVLPRTLKQSDESLASFVTRRFGREALERVAQPMISGIYTADPEKLSLRATMPRFLEMEERYGSIIRAMLREQHTIGQRQSCDIGARYSLFMSFKDGMQTLVDALETHLPEGTVKLNKRMKSVAISNGGWSLITDEGERFHADGVIITTPSYHAARLVEGFDPSLAEDLSKIQYASSAVISLAYRREDISHPLDGFGFVVPMIEKRGIIACSFSSVKFRGRAPEGYALLRCFIGGAIQPEAYEWDDSSMIDRAHKEVSELLQIKSRPLFTMVHRHPNSMPQYQVGHLEHIARINEKVSKYRGLALAGSAYSGVGIPDCVHSGETAAEGVLKAVGYTK
jgi:oxygen-dependent protoporphyrinogen oxidase